MNVGIALPKFMLDIKGTRVSASEREKVRVSASVREGVRVRNSEGVRVSESERVWEQEEVRVGMSTSVGCVATGLEARVVSILSSPLTV